MRLQSKLVPLGALLFILPLAESVYTHTDQLPTKSFCLYTTWPVTDPEPHYYMHLGLYKSEGWVGELACTTLLVEIILRICSKTMQVLPDIFTSSGSQYPDLCVLEFRTLNYDCIHEALRCANPEAPILETCQPVSS